MDSFLFLHQVYMAEQAGIDIELRLTEKSLEVRQTKCSSPLAVGIFKILILIQFHRKILFDDL